MSPKEIHEQNLGGTSTAILAKRLGVTRSTVCGIMFRHRQHLERDDRDLRICKLIDDGLAFEVICDQESASFGHVKSLAREISK